MRILFLLGGITAGIIISVILLFIWTMLRWQVLGYGDSGPDWISTVNTWIQVISIGMGIVASQWLYHRIKNKSKGSESL